MLTEGDRFLSELGNRWNLKRNFDLGPHPCPCGFLGDTKHDCTCTPR
jgi:hypothetical protein